MLFIKQLITKPNIESFRKSLKGGSIVVTLKDRLKNYTKAISYVQKYDKDSAFSLLAKAEKLKQMQKDIEKGKEVDR